MRKKEMESIKNKNKRDDFKNILAKYMAKSDAKFCRDGRNYRRCLVGRIPFKYDVRHD